MAGAGAGRSVLTLLDGRALAAEIRAAATEAATSISPVVAAVLATDDPGAAWYAGSLAKSAEATGIELRQTRLAAHDAAGVLTTLDALSADSGVHWIICLTPLPAGLTLAEAGEHIAPAKDVDGASPASLGRLAAGLPAYAPATAQAVIELLEHSGTPL